MIEPLLSTSVGWPSVIQIIVLLLIAQANLRGAICGYTHLKREARRNRARLWGLRVGAVLRVLLFVGLPFAILAGVHGATVLFSVALLYQGLRRGRKVAERFLEGWLKQRTDVQQGQVVAGAVAALHVAATRGTVILLLFTVG